MLIKNRLEVSKGSTDNHNFSNLIFELVLCSTRVICKIMLIPKMHVTFAFSIRLSRWNTSVHMEAL